MINYYNKYLKYKKKYLKLKKMKGGYRPHINNIKNINLFNKYSEEWKYLNPQIGFILADSSFIRNYTNFGYDLDVKKFISKIYHSNDNINYKPINKFTDLKINKDIFLQDLGKYLYFRFKIKDINHEDIINKIKLVKDKIMLLQEETTIRDNLRNIIKKKKRKKLERKINTINNIKKEIRKNLYITDELFENFNENKLDDYIIKLDKELKILEPTYTYNRLIKFLNKYWKINKNEKIYYHIVLSIIWWLSDDKNGIKSYYLGFKKEEDIIPIFNEENEDIFAEKIIELYKKKFIY